MNRRVVQGYPVSPTIFNIVVYAVVMEMLLEVCWAQEAHPGLFWEAGEDIKIFYEEDRCIAGCNTIWFQTTLMAVVRTSERVRLKTNLSKTIAM